MKFPTIASYFLVLVSFTSSLKIYSKSFGKLRKCLTYVIINGFVDKYRKNAGE